MRIKIGLLFVVLWSGLLLSCTPQKQYFEEVGTVFHTSFQIKYEASRSLRGEIDAELQKFNLSLNPFDPNSIIAKVNRNEPVETDPWFDEVFQKAMEVSEKSDGMFDITCAPFINLWGFGFSRMDSVTPAIVDSLKAFVGYRKVRLENRRIVKDDPRLMLNCSAIAKGYSCDIVARLLERENVENYMIVIGGEVVVKGVNQAGKCWRIGINKPEEDRSGTINEIEVKVDLCKKGGIATSGNYRNFYVKDGKKYAHTIDPKTGYPSEQTLLSATIVAPDCMTADAYATACMAMGVEKATRMMEQLPDLDYFFIYTDKDGKYQSTCSEGMLRYLIDYQTGRTTEPAF